MRFARPIPPDLGKTGDADSGAAQARGRFAPSRTVMRIFAARAFPGKSRILAYRRDLNSTDFSFRKQASFETQTPFCSHATGMIPSWRRWRVKDSLSVVHGKTSCRRRRRKKGEEDGRLSAREIGHSATRCDS